MPSQSLEPKEITSEGKPGAQWPDREPRFGDGMYLLFLVHSVRERDNFNNKRELTGLWAACAGTVPIETETPLEMQNSTVGESRPVWNAARTRKSKHSQCTQVTDRT